MSPVELVRQGFPYALRRGPKARRAPGQFCRGSQYMVTIRQSGLLRGEQRAGGSVVRQPLCACKTVRFYGVTARL